MYKEILRCAHCNKKLRSTNHIDCQCGHIYCYEHRYPFIHNCQYDSISISIYHEQLKKNNPVIMKPQIDKI